MKRHVVVVNRPEDWPLDVEGIEVVSSRDYLTAADWSRAEGVRVFNLARSMRYQRLGYYVSLLAEARGHRPLPSVDTIQDLKSVTVLNVANDDLDESIQKSLAPIRADTFELSVYFGHNVAARHDTLAQAIFRRFRAPLLRAWFKREPAPADDRWVLANVTAIGASDVPEHHVPFVVDVTKAWLASRQMILPVRTGVRYDLAILRDPAEAQPPSDERAIQRFVRAASAVGFGVEVIGRDDFARVAEFDALFIRETTAVNHHTYRFARRAHAEGLVVMDDPASILRCTNKVFLAEVLRRHRVPAPKTLIVHRKNVAQIAPALGFPVVLKQPDSAFSVGVKKADDAVELARIVDELLEGSELIVAQAFIPTTFDWRIGVLDRQALFAARYFMARKHWQIIDHAGDGPAATGEADTLPIESAPRHVVKAAVRAANLMGDGLYGVDVKEVDGRAYVIEVNDNPNIDAGYEDAVLGDELYRRIMRVFMGRVERRKARRS